MLKKAFVDTLEQPNFEILNRLDMLFSLRNSTVEVEMSKGEMCALPFRLSTLESVC